MAIFKFFKRADVKNLGSLGNVIAYCVQQKKTKYENDYLVSGILCTPQTALRDFIMTKKLFGKEDGMQYYYAVQSFETDAGINPLTAHKMALELAERCYPDYQVLVATHTDTDNVHSHLIINSVNSANGKKIHQNKDKLYECRKINDEICMKYGTTVCKPNNKKTFVMTSAEYYSMLNGRSWKLLLCTAITKAMKVASSKEEFIKMMNDYGYEVDWEDNHKHITYKKRLDDKCLACRDNKLHEEKYLKENMVNEFSIREKNNVSISGRTDDKNKSGRENFKNGSIRTKSSNANRRKLEESNSNNSKVSFNTSNNKQDVGKDSYKDRPEGLHNRKRKNISDELSKCKQFADGEVGRVQFEENGNSGLDDKWCETGWEKERECFERYRNEKAKLNTEDNIEFYNPLDSGMLSFNRINNQHNSTDKMSKTTFDLIADIAESFENYDDEIDYETSGIDKKELKKIKEKKESQGLHMSM